MDNFHFHAKWAAKYLSQAGGRKRRGGAIAYIGGISARRRHLPERTVPRFQSLSCSGGTTPRLVITQWGAEAHTISNHTIQRRFRTVLSERALDSLSFYRKRQFEDFC